jgi:hypothetical protein
MLYPGLTNVKISKVLFGQESVVAAWKISNWKKGNILEIFQMEIFSSRRTGFESLT